MPPVNSLISKFETISQQSTPPPDLQRVSVKKYTMPLRQSTLRFQPEQSSTLSSKVPQMPLKATKQQMSTTPEKGDVAADTIIVDLSESTSRPPLPTPSDSATDVSSQTSAPLDIRYNPRSRLKRVPEPRKKDSKETLVAIEEQANGDEKYRSISGETLVTQTAGSPSKLLKTGIDALNLTWNIDDVFDDVNKMDFLKQTNKDDEQQSTISVDDSTEDEETRNARRAAKKAKMEENARKWAERQKSAEDKATRRSSRASLLVLKAGDVMSDFATNVLGKKSGKDRVSELSGQDRKRSNSAMGMSTIEVAEDFPEQKKQRHSEDDSLSAAARAIRNRAPKDKKWLISGLYAGQNRSFNPSLSGPKNKRKNETEQKQIGENKILPLPMFAGERLLQNGRDFKLPFDIFSPLPNGQPKPDEWKRVNKSVFIGDAAAEWRTSKFQEHSTCLCTSENGCDQNCMNRYMYYECNEKNCNLDPDQCRNRAFDGLRQRVKKGGKYNIGVEVIKTRDRGYGVRSNRTFEPHQIIVEYTGEILTQEECETRMRTIYKDNECYYLMAFDQNMIIDATRGSIARFVNHSCEPNCRMEKWTVGDKPRMALFAGDKGIMTGEELTYDYNFDPYSQKNVQECRCGASGCRGILGPRSKDEKKRVSPTIDAPVEKSKKEGKFAGAKRKIAEALGESTSLLNKKRKPTPEIIPPTMPASKLKRMLSDAKNKNNNGHGRRVISTVSENSTSALITNDNASTRSIPSRSGSLKKKAETMLRKSGVTMAVKAR